MNSSTSAQAADGPRLERIRASAAIARLAIGQITEEIAAGAADKAVLAEAVRAVYREDSPLDGILGALGRLLITTADRSSLTDLSDDDDNSAACALQEAAADFTDTVGMRLWLASRALDPQGEPAL